MIQTPDMPRDSSCWEVNPVLFAQFQKLYFIQTRQIATKNWTEAEVTQWLDVLLDDKYLHGTLDENHR
jgi:hypothetical protein